MTDNCQENGAIKDLDDVYWDRNIVKARINAEKELEDTTNRIVLMVLGGFINPNNTEFEFSQDIEPCYGGFGTRLGEFVRGERHHRVTIDDGELYDFAKELMYNYWQG